MKKKLLLIATQEEQQLIAKRVIKALKGRYGLQFFSYGSIGDLRDFVPLAPVVLVSAKAAPAGGKVYRIDPKKPLLILTNTKDFQADLKRISQMLPLAGHSWKLCIPEDDQFLDLVASFVNITHHPLRLTTQLHALQQSQAEKKGKTPLYRSLMEAEEDIKKKNKALTQITEQLQDKVAELQQWETLTVGRELRIVELKKKVKELEGKRKR